MAADRHQDQDIEARGKPRLSRYLPFAVLALAMLVAFAMGWHRQFSLETLVKHRTALDTFVSDHYPTALAAYLGIYVLAVALSIPGAVFLTISGGALFGWLVGGVGTIVGATAGAVLVFLAASGMFRDLLSRRTGALGAKLVAGFQTNAFSYLLFLRLVPIFPFWLVNITAALVGVPFWTFVGATSIGIIPATFAFAFLGQGLDSAIAAQAETFKDCLGAGRNDCRLDFDIGNAFTPELIAAIVVLALVSLLPVVIQRVRETPPIAK